MDTLLTILVIAVVAVAAVWGFYAAAKRKKEMISWAQAHSLSFSEHRDSSLDETYPRLGCLRQGSNRYGHNHLTGRWKEHDFHGFDYHYETYSHDSKGHRQTHHHHFSAVILNSKFPLQELFIRPEGVFDKLTEFFGADDIDFESTDFSNKFYVKASDKKWAFDVIHQRTMQFLLDSPRFSIQFDPACIIAYRSSRFDGREFGEAADVICGILERLPDYVVQQLTGKR